ncbi:MAG TPA: DsbA family oxidoreductase [Spirochaetia bacterium]
MTIEIWADVVCPWCYIGKRRFESALARFPHRDEVRVIHRSFELDPEAPTELGLPLDEMLAAKYGVAAAEARKMNARVTELAAGEGLAYRLDIARPGNSLDAHRLVHLASARGLDGAMVERLMKAYFTEGVPIADRESLVRCAVDVGLDADEVRRALAGDTLTAEVRADEERAATFGISGVPFFAIEETWGISGAQPREAFEDALDSSWRELHEAKTGAAGSRHRPA